MEAFILCVLIRKELKPRQLTDFKCVERISKEGNTFVFIHCSICKGNIQTVMSRQTKYMQIKLPYLLTPTANSA